MIPIATPILEVRDLHTEFRTPRGVSQAVSGISFVVEEQEIVALVGESGSGKTVTAMSIMGLLPAGTARITSGEIWFDGQDLSKLADRQLDGIRGRGLSMIFQNSLSVLDPSYPIGEQLAEVISARQQLNKKEAVAEAARVLGEAGIADVGRVLTAYPHQLSGGMRQRVLIALAISCKPKLIIADEPTTALDSTVQKQILALLKGINERHGTAMIIITHDFGVVANLCDSVAVMRDGVIVETGRTRDVLRDPQHAYTRSLIQALPERKLAERKRRDREVRPAPVPLVEVQGAGKTFALPGGFFWQKRTFTAVQDVDLTIDAGEIVGLIGESGSGKSTLARMIARLILPSEGRILFDGADLARLDRNRMQPYYRRLQMVFQDSGSSLNPRIPIGEQLLRPILRLGAADSAAEAERRVHRLLDRVGLRKEHYNRYPHEFSGGQRQRIGIARALGVQPELLILDEPTSALDASVQAQVLDLLLELRDEFDLTYLFIGHNLSVVSYFCDRVAVMEKHRLVEVLPVAALREQASHPATRRLLDSVLAIDPVSSTAQTKTNADYPVLV